MSSILSTQIINEKLNKFKKLELNKATINSVEAWLRMELTYSSNAIEGNTLTRQETALVVNDNLSVAGKDITEILEVLNHEKAIQYILDLSKKTKVADINEDIILNIHSILIKTIDEQNAGKYRSVPVRISGSMMIPPNYLKVKDLMKKLIINIQKPKIDSILVAIQAHYELVSIHPFVDGNGRTARLLFNLILLINGFPFVYVAKEERSQYLKALEKAQTGGSMVDYEQLMLNSISRSLDKYLNIDSEVNSDRVYKIGELSSITSVPISTIRFWVGEGLVNIFNTTTSGYAVFDSNSINRIQNIQKLKSEKRMTIEEIKKLLK